jgi:hypothetical protein
MYLVYIIAALAFMIVLMIVNTGVAAKTLDQQAQTQRDLEELRKELQAKIKM